MKCKRFILLFTVLFLAAALLGCSKKPDGYWYAVDGAPYGYPDEIEFLDDKMCIVDSMSGVFDLNKDTLMISVMGQVFTYRYSRLDKEFFTLDDGYGAITYSSDFNARFAPAAEAPAAEFMPMDTPTPTLSPEELAQIAYDEDSAALNAKLAEYDANNDIEGALQYLNEQLQLLQTTYSNADFSEFEQQRTQYLDIYRQQSLDSAKTAFETIGYEDALNALYHSTTLLGGEDERIVAAIAYYKQFGPIAFEDYFNSYFYNECTNGAWSLKYDIQDNTGETYPVAVKIYADLTSHKPTKYVYLLTGNHSSFTGRLFLGEQTRSTNSEQIVRIYGDDTLLWESPAMTKSVSPVDFNVDLTGYAQMTIVSEVTAFRDYDHVNIFIANGSLNP